MTFNTIMNDRGRYGSFFTPLCDTLSTTIKCQHSIRSFISCLSRTGGPAHISSLIMSVYVNAIQRIMSRRAFPDVIKERFEVLKFNFNTPSSVIMKSFVGWITAPFFRFRIGSKLRGPFSSLRLSMSDSGTSSAFARCRFSLKKISTCNDFQCTAITSTQPLGYSLFSSSRGTSSVSQYMQSPKSLVAQIFDRSIQMRRRVIVLSRHVIFSILESDLFRAVRGSSLFQPACILS